MLIFWGTRLQELEEVVGMGLFRRRVGRLTVTRYAATRILSGA